jgi:quercetin dioxygenase-like cupin family protein
MIKTYRDVFGADVDLHYCEEHAHIDQHHGRITREQLLLALARQHGDGVVPELIRGIAEARLLGSWFEEDTAAQIRWADSIAAHRVVDAAALTDGGEGRPVELSPGHPFGTRNHDEPVVLVMADGEADLVTTATGEPERLAKGDALLVPAGRVYGIRASARGCSYRLHRAVLDSAVLDGAVLDGAVTDRAVPDR